MSTLKTLPMKAWKRNKMMEWTNLVKLNRRTSLNPAKTMKWTKSGHNWKVRKSKKPKNPEKTKKWTKTNKLRPTRLKTYKIRTKMYKWKAKTKTRTKKVTVTLKTIQTLTMERKITPWVKDASSFK